MKSAIPAKDPAMSDAMTIARDRVETLALPKGWHETKDARRARVARLIGTTARRVRSILAGEKMRLTAEEYLAIERAWESAHASVATISALGSHAALQLGRSHGALGAGPHSPGRPTDEGERRGPAGTTTAR